MAADPANLLVNLHRLASRQDENFLTECFADLLRRLLRSDPQVGVSLLDQLTDSGLSVDPADANDVRIDTQVITSGGRPDMAIACRGHLVYVEVKVDADLHYAQLSGYRRALEESGAAKQTLVLLTRHRDVQANALAQPDASMRWFKVADILRGAVRENEIKSGVGMHVAKQFLGLLKARGLTMEKVGVALVEGLKSMSNLHTMLSEAIHDAEETPKKNSKNEFRGYGIEGNRYWVGIRFYEPNLLSFCTDYLDQFIPEHWEALRKGQVVSANWLPLGQRWRYDIDLTSPDVPFFTLDRAEQQAFLAEFVRDCMAMARGAVAAQEATRDDAPPSAS